MIEKDWDESNMIVFQASPVEHLISVRKEAPKV